MGSRARIDRDRRVGIVLAAVALATQIVLDLVVATLQPRIADQRVLVHRRTAQIVHRQQLRAAVDQLQALQADADLVLFDVADRRERHVAGQAEHITHGAGTEERQLDVARATPAPCTQRLAEVFLAVGDHRLAGRIEQATDTQRRVHQEATQRVPGIIRTALQQLVDDRYRRAQVAEEVAHTGAGKAWHHVGVSRRQRSRDGIVDRHVEPVHLAVERFPRVVGHRVASRTVGAVQRVEIIVAAGLRSGSRGTGSSRRVRGRRRIGRGRFAAGHGGGLRCRCGGIGGGIGGGGRAGRNQRIGNRRIAARGLAGTGAERGGQDDQGESAYDVHVSSQQK